MVGLRRDLFKCDIYVSRETLACVKRDMLNIIVIYVQLMKLEHFKGSCRFFQKIIYLKANPN